MSIVGGDILNHIVWRNRRSNSLALHGLLLALLVGASGCLDAPDPGDPTARVATDAARAEAAAPVAIPLVKSWERVTLGLDVGAVCTIVEEPHGSHLSRYDVTRVEPGTRTLVFEVEYEGFTSGLRVGASLDAGPIQWSEAATDDFRFEIPITADMAETGDHRWTFHVSYTHPADGEGCSTGWNSGERTIRVTARG